MNFEAQIFLKFLFLMLLQIISGLQNLDRDNVASVVTAADKVGFFNCYNVSYESYSE